MKFLFGTFKYLFLWHPTKLLIDVILPLILAIIIFLIRLFYYESSGLVGETGFLNLIIPLVAALSGFYIAALTAISAFPIASLDEAMPGDAITFFWEPDRKNPTRREFLSLQFGYLACISILLFVICIISIFLESFITQIEPFSVLNIKIGAILNWSALMFILFFVFNLLFVTLLSVYYLAIKIHEYEPKATGGPKIRSTEN